MESQIVEICWKGWGTSVYSKQVGKCVSWGSSLLRKNILKSRESSRAKFVNIQINTDIMAFQKPIGILWWDFRDTASTWYSSEKYSLNFKGITIQEILLHNVETNMYKMITCFYLWIGRWVCAADGLKIA